MNATIAITHLLSMTPRLLCGYPNSSPLRYLVLTHYIFSLYDYYENLSWWGVLATGIEHVYFSGLFSRVYINKQSKQNHLSISSTISLTLPLPYLSIAYLRKAITFTKFRSNSTQVTFTATYNSRRMASLSNYQGYQEMFSATSLTYPPQRLLPRFDPAVNTMLQCLYWTIKLM